MRKVTIGLALLFACAVAFSAPHYEFKLTLKQGEPIVWGTFAGKDADSDGFLTEKELTLFSEHTSISLFAASRGDWAEDFEKADFPKITHSLADLKAISFSEQEWKKKKTASLEYKTNTRADVEAKELFFWRSVELSESGKKVAIYDGVSNGKEGLEVNMTEKGAKDGLALTVRFVP